MGLFTGPTRLAWVAACLIIPLGYAACDSSADTATTAGTSTGGAAASGGGTASNNGGSSASQGGNTFSSGVGGPPTTESPCAGKIYECGDLVDNDSDGLIDYQDEDCLGPCDNTEDSYYPDLPGMSGAPCKTDCFWEQGNGNDDCSWDHQCDPLQPEQDCPYDANFIVKSGQTCDQALNDQPPACTDACQPLTPNGCDCFGCCELPAGSDQFVWLGSYDDDKNGTCTVDDVNDPTKCKPCTFVPGCSNDCAKCEYCIGKPTLPPECFDPGTGGNTGAGGSGGNPGQCPPEFPACGGPGQGPCEVGTYCITGCCVPLPN